MKRRKKDEDHIMKSMNTSFKVLRSICLTLVFILGFITIVATGGGGDDAGNSPPIRNTNFEVEESFYGEVEVGYGSLLVLEGINGDIIITGVNDTNSVVITGMKRVRSDSTYDAEEHLREIEVNVQSFANEIFIETIQPQDTEYLQYQVDYEITLPKDLEIQLDSANGDIILDSINNDVTVYHMNGDVTLIEIFGSPLVDLINGDVTLIEIFGSPFVYLVNGDIESDVTLPLNGIIDFYMVNGSIDLYIPANTSAEFSAAVSIGDISISNLVLGNEVRTSTSLSGSLGYGQGTIFLEIENAGYINVFGF